MKAIILAAGVGSRLRPLTDNSPKSLLTVGDKKILERMIENLLSVDVKEIAIVTGYLHEKVEAFVAERFPELSVTFIHNDKYLDTNTGYSLLLTREFAKDDSFVKFDADVVFDREILEKLLTSSYETSLCIDRNINLAAEEVKVKVDDNNRVLRAHKTVPPEEAIGESIGIEKISADCAKQLYAELEEMMQDPANHQEYYEGAYERLIDTGVPFYATDITGLKWVEIDNHDDFQLAQEYFGSLN